jgi:hypothetical protein
MLASNDKEQTEEPSEKQKRLAREAQKRFRDRNPDRARELRRICEAKENSKEKRRLRQRRGNLQTRLRAIAEMGGKCSHCQQAYHHAAMDFHHVDPGTKEVKGRGLPTGNSWENIKRELAKTILLCSNCHRIHHYKERNPND